jgi:tripartite-type tricarboxylate transporter receptor subunit TctC
MIVPYAPGGPLDVMGRYLGQKLTADWGQAVVVDPRGGAGGMIGTDIAAKSNPDGYTMLLANAGPITINPILHKKPPYDPFKELAPVTMAIHAPMVLMVGPSLKANSLKEVLQTARAKANGVIYASAGVGNLQHLAMELMSSMAGVEMVHVPYKGAAPAFTDLASGRVHLMFANIVGALPQIKAGRFKPIAVSSARRSSVLPDVPSVAEAGLPEFDINGWLGVYVPAGTSQKIVQKLNRDYREILRRPDVTEWFVSRGCEMVGSDPQHLTKYTRDERALYAKIIKRAGIQPQ